MATAKVNFKEISARPNYFYPDIYGRENCVYHNGYFDWMMGSVSCDCLFDLLNVLPRRSLSPFLTNAIALLFCIWSNAAIQYSESYLFDTGVDCCSKWYPARADCPDLSEPTERDVIEKPYPVTGYFYPHQVESNCRFGRNYPQCVPCSLEITIFARRLTHDACPFVIQVDGTETLPPTLLVHNARRLLFNLVPSSRW